ncbi:MAG: response regulator [Deltaproteobacteria bacterium]|nr:response regulator [Deltaproteobacteria bacterium]
MRVNEILLINDNSFLLRMMARRLEEKGYPVCLTDSPERAVSIISNLAFESVVLKLSEEDSARLAILPMIKEINPETKLIIVSEADFLPIEVFEADFDDFISLPCSPLKLWRRLTAQLSGPSTNYRGDLFYHPANYRIIQMLLASLQEVRQNLLDNEVHLTALLEKPVSFNSGDGSGHLEKACRLNARSVFLVDSLLAKLTGHDFFQDQVDCYDI